MFVEDTKGLPTCEHVEHGCPKLWPAFTSTGTPVLGAGLDRRLVRIVRGAHGVAQVSYNRHPLYYYENDLEIGDTNGQDFYSLWYVLSPKGVPIKK
jgi:predicted lipoprotein with Yx(FWY)xxD motif